MPNKVTHERSAHIPSWPRISQRLPGVEAIVNGSVADGVLMSSATQCEPPSTESTGHCNRSEDTLRSSSQSGSPCG